MKETSQIVIYKSKDGNTSIDVKLENETVWLSQKQMSKLFQKDSDTIGLHLKNIYNSKELSKKGTTEKYSVVQKEGKRSVKRNILFYNLDAIISVGYRVNSKRGILFRKWATTQLKNYLIKGFAINQEKLTKQNKQLLELKKTIKILSNVLSDNELSNDENRGLLDIISDYSYALDVLDKYDYQSLKIEHTTTSNIYQLTYEESVAQIQLVKKHFDNTDLFGREKDKSFRSSIATIYQTFEGKDLYESIEEKASNLLYFIVKNHSFSDGNKRIAAFIFLYFLEKNNLLRNTNGQKRIADNTLVALTLMIAVSKSEEKDTMIKIIVNLINKNN